MSNPEFGSYNPEEENEELEEDFDEEDELDDEDEEEKESAEQLKEKANDLVDGIKRECGHILDNLENAARFNTILKLVRSNYRKDPDEWDRFAEDFQSELSPVDDENEISDILIHFERKANSLIE